VSKRFATVFRTERPSKDRASVVTNALGCMCSSGCVDCWLSEWKEVDNIN
jgi:hypothetical protein